jgi:rRNA pseudouridine-1189 N-methylase Emg1 (Nep1/Mra1 family)
MKYASVSNKKHMKNAHLRTEVFHYSLMQIGQDPLQTKNLLPSIIHSREVSLLTWKSKKHTAVAPSSANAKYTAIAHTARE